MSPFIYMYSIIQLLNMISLRFSLACCGDARFHSIKVRWWAAALYIVDGVPWLLDARKGMEDDLLPTVLALWGLPCLLPHLPVRHAIVSRFLLSAPPCCWVPWAQPDIVLQYTEL